MLGLLYKDFCVLKRNFLSVAIGALIISCLLFLPWGKIVKEQTMGGVLYAELLTYVHIPLFVYFFLFLMVGFLQGVLFPEDERKVWSCYITATPLGYKGQILSKYFMTLALSFAVVVWGYVCDTICMLTSGYYGSACGIYLVFFYLQIIMQALEYPFIIRFGHKHGNTYKLLLLVAFFFVIMVYLLFGKLPENFSMNTIFDFVMKLLMNETALPTAMMGILAVLPYAAAILFYLSYKLSCRWYLKGVETYEV